MADGITSGTTGTFAAVLDLNGAAVSPQPSFSWATNVPDAVVTPSADTLSAVIAIPAGETATSITVTATTTAADGKTYSGELTVPISAPMVFTVTVTQTA